MGGRLLTRTVAVAGTSLCLAVAACFAPSTALAGLLSESTTASGVAVATWSAIPTAVDGTTAVTSVNIAAGTGANRYALINVVNNGTVSLSGFTLAANRAAGVSACGQAWTIPTGPGQTVPTCAPGATNLGTLSGSGTSRLAASITVAAGAKVQLRVGPFNAANVGSLGVTVTRANVS